MWNALVWLDLVTDDLFCLPLAERGDREHIIRGNPSPGAGRVAGPCLEGQATRTRTQPWPSFSPVAVPSYSNLSLCLGLKALPPLSIARALSQMTLPPPILSLESVYFLSNPRDLLIFPITENCCSWVLCICY